MMTRLEKYRNAFPSDCDAAFITSELNVRYLGGVNYNDGFLLITREKAFLFADSRYLEVAKRDVSSGFEVILLNKRRSECIKDALPDIKSIAFEDGTVTCAELEAYKKGLEGVEFRAAGAIVERLRNEKDDCEK